MSALVSVVMPVRNGRRFLEEAVASVVGQTYEPLELLVVDDASADGSRALAEHLAGRYDNVQAFALPAPAGAAAARNHGLARAAGSLFTFLDADDLMVADRVARQVAWLGAHAEADAVIAGEQPLVEPDAPRDLIRRRRSRGQGLPFHLMSMMVRRSSFERVGGFDGSYVVAEDLDWLFRAGRAGLIIGRLDAVLTCHRLHASNLSFRTREIQRSMLRSLRSRIEERRGRDARS